MIHDTHWVEMIAKSPESGECWCFYFMLKHTAPYDLHCRAMDQVYEWCLAMFGDPSDRWDFSHDLFYLRDDSDAALFKLTWC